MTAYDLTLNRSMTALALASRADSVADDVEMHLPNGYGYSRVFFRHDGEVTLYSDDHGHDTFAGDEFAVEVIGAVVDFADDDPAWADQVMTREELRTAFGDAWVASVEAVQTERMAA